jgi:Zn-dependent protease with chaperone function
MFIENPQLEKKEFSIDRVFATHPPIEQRIKLLEQFV